MLRFSELFSGLEPGRRLNDAQSTIAYLILKYALIWRGGLG